MKCSICHTKNSVKANYCIHCSYKFSEEEKKIAKNKGIVPKIEKLEEFFNVLSLKIITDNIFFRLFFLLLLLIPGIYCLSKNGNHLKILNSDQYHISYNESTNDYALYLKNKDLDDYGKIHLNLFVPNSIEKIQVRYYDENDEVLYDKEFTKDEPIVLEANTINNNYYFIESNKDSFKVFVYFDREVF